VKYKIVLSREAEKAILHLNPKDFLAVSGILHSLEEEPWLIRSKKIVGTNLYRIRVRNYRVIYFVDNEHGIVYVERIAQRSKSTYKGL